MLTKCVCAHKFIWLVLKNVRNPAKVFLMYLDGKPRIVKFWNGFSEVLDPHSIQTLIEFISRGWNLRNLKEGKFVASKGNLRVVFERLKHKDKHNFYQLSCYKVSSTVSDTTETWLMDGMKLVGTLSQFHILFDGLEQQYRVFNYNDKVVLDVGGFIGETAVLFKF